MSRRLHQTMADYVVIAISPALIMALVGSLVFFLIAVLYQGEFAGRLNWVMACFVFAAVLISRISIEDGFERAVPFGVALAIVVAMAASRFVEVKAGSWLDSFGWLINWALIALIWWCTDRLTWDCTVIDDAEDASGEGLLQIAGLERRPGEDDAKTKSPQQIEGTTSREVPHGWWERYVEARRRPHAPGVWVVYFSLAALPLFGFGQWFIPAVNTGGRRYAFWLLCVYVGSGLGLLLTTSFLGLRRYLRQRRIEMPTPMANLWLGTGVVLILLLLVAAALLPRPSAEYAVSQLPFTVGSPTQHASPAAPTNREGVEDEQPGTAPDDKLAEPDAPPSGSEPPTDDTDQSDSGSADSKSSEPSDKSDDSKDARDRDGKSPQSKSPSSSQQSGKGKSPSPSGKSSSSSGQQGKEPSKSNSQPSKPDQAKADSAKSSPEKSPPPNETADNSPPPAESSPPPPSLPDMAPPAALEAITSSLGEIVKLVVYGIVGLAIVYLMWRSRTQVLAFLRNLLAELAALWNQLWGNKKPRPKPAAEMFPELPPAPFSSFADPFATGIAGRYTASELVRYSFEAFEAWAGEHDCPRHPEQTPHEFARVVGQRHTAISTAARQLAELYARAAFSRGELPANALDQLRQLWQSMRPREIHRG